MLFHLILVHLSILSLPAAAAFCCERAKFLFDMEISGSIWLAAFFVFWCLYIFIDQLLDHSVTFPESIPVVGLRRELLKTVRASIRQLTDGVRTLLDGYRQVPSKQHSIAVLIKTNRQPWLVFPIWPTFPH